MAPPSLLPDIGRSKLSLAALDVGARGGVNDDLAMIAPAVDYYLMEPDREEAERLRRSGPDTRWRSFTVIEEALAADAETFVLNLYRQRGCSSKLAADRELSALFCRQDYYILDDTAQVQARALDMLVEDGALPSPDFMKIDVQGMEAEVFAGAKRVLRDSLVGVRTEVSFFPIYRDQPLFAEIDRQLRPYGFVPMRWIEFHEWRRTTRVKYPRTVLGPLPASRGQMIHGDVLYLRHPESLPAESEANRSRLARLGLVALCYDHLDHAAAAFARSGDAAWLRERIGIDPDELLASASRRLARRARHEARLARIGRWLGRLAPGVA